MRTLAKAALVGLLFVAASAPASAYRSSRPRLELLTPSILRKVVACYRAVEQAEDRATGGRSEVYKNRARLRDAALARCGFPKTVVWRNAAYSARIAASDLAGDAPLDEPRATNRTLAAPFKAELARLFPDG